MSKTITDYTAAATIDATADYLLEYQASSGVYKKINRNTLLGITGSPIGTTDTQVLTNKTIGSTNTVTLKDTLFTLQDDGDTTKQAKFQLSGITTGNTRTYTLPNASVTLASLTGTETFTNKTITSPAITGGTIDNATITVDSISGHTTSTIVTVGGVQMSNGVVNTASAVTATSIATGAVTPAALVAGTGSGWTWTSYSPSLTNVTIGNGTVSARYIQIGKTVFYRGYLSLGSTSSVTGNISLTIPVTARTDAGYEVSVAPIGDVIYIDAATNQYGGIVYMLSSTTMAMQSQNAAATYITTTTAVAAAVPFTFGTGDGFIWTVMYEAA